MFQWHPLFAHLLRPVLQDAYEVQTGVPVGDLPRQADIVVVRRIAARPRFHGLWRHLTALNVMEFKGRTESARIDHLDLLLEVGLGIRRHTNEKRKQEGLPEFSQSEVSFWYLARHLGRRFLPLAERRLGNLETVDTGLWRARVLEHDVWLVSGRTVPLDRESMPVHLVSEETIAEPQRVAEWIVEEPAWLKEYSPWLATFYKDIWQEVIDMARKKGTKKPPYDLEPLIEWIGMKGLVEQIGWKRLIEELGPKRVAEELRAQLSPAERAELRRELE